MLLRKENYQNVINSAPAQVDYEVREVLNEHAFVRALGIERKRTERSGDSFLLMLFDFESRSGEAGNDRLPHHLMSMLSQSIRETDIIGWYAERHTAGVMFIGLPRTERKSTENVILSKMRVMLQSQLSRDEFTQIRISLHVFPDDWDHEKPGRPSNPLLYHDIAKPEKGITSLLRMKVVIDVVGSLLALILCSPLFVLIALAIKISSTGPVFFRQRRVGRYGRCFTFLKFRSMYTDNDDLIHKTYVSKLIAGQVDNERSNGSGKSIYKLTNDKRITRVGKWLRRTSLDELPQLINVLKGEMSLVGPRPAIPYELAMYQTWHRRRVLEVKPGITGLWQVSGRSRVKFDEMVRLDIRYAKSWSLWLDLMILIRTPGAVMGGAGAC